MGAAAAQVLYLKIDIEGHEPAAFRGMKKLLKDHVVHVILWEDSPNLYTEAGRARPPATMLSELGYWVSERNHGGAGNYVAVHPRADKKLKRKIEAMKYMSIKDVNSHRGLGGLPRRPLPLPSHYPPTHRPRF